MIHATHVSLHSYCSTNYRWLFDSIAIRMYSSRKIVLGIFLLVNIYGWVAALPAVSTAIVVGFYSLYRNNLLKKTKKQYKK